MSLLTRLYISALSPPINSFYASLNIICDGAHLHKECLISETREKLKFPLDTQKWVHKEYIDY